MKKSLRHSESFVSSLFVGSIIVLTLITLAWPPITTRADIGTQSAGITNTIAAATTNTAPVANIIKIDNQDTCGLQFRIQGDASGTGAVTLKLARSVDGTTFETAPQITLATALNGTTAVVVYTNISTTFLGAAGYLKVVYIANADATANATNVLLTVIKKNTR